MRRFKPKTKVDRLIAYGVNDSSLGVLGDELSVIPDPEKVIDFLVTARSATEQRWSEVDRMMLLEETGKQVYFAGYEWMSFKMPGGSYTPDWAYLLENGQWVFVEIKASKSQKGYRDARSKLRAAATLNPWFLFYEAMSNRGVFVLERIEGDTEYIHNLKLVVQEQLPEVIKRGLQ